MNKSAPLARTDAPPPPTILSGAKKAAIVVQFLLNEGADLPLDDLPDPLQETLTTHLGAMRFVDRETLAQVTGEFAAALEAMGLTFPRDMAGALSVLDGRISPQTAARLRKEAGVRQFGDPWALVAKAGNDDLVALLQTEGQDVAAIILSRLAVPRAAELLGLLPGPCARQLAFGMSRIGAVTPDAVDRIGLALATQLQGQPEPAFAGNPIELISSILNNATSDTRDDVLEGLEETDTEFAAQVRRSIFTFAHIPARLAPVDVPKLLREVDRATLITALQHAKESDLGTAAEFVLDNLSRRMADTLREEIGELDPVAPRAGEEAMTRVANAVRQLETAGEITLRQPAEDLPAT